MHMHLITGVHMQDSVAITATCNCSLQENHKLVHWLSPEYISRVLHFLVTPEQ